MLVNDSRLDAEFRVWLSETKGKKFGDLDEKETKKYFEKVCLWQVCAAHLACACVLVLVRVAASSLCVHQRHVQKSIMYAVR